MIPCGGDQSRWNGPGRKQLIEIDGAPLLERTLRQVRQRYSESDIRVLADVDEIVRLWPSAFMPEQHRTLCESLNSMPVDRDRVTILLGDVLFTDAALDRIATDERNPQTTFYGADFEIYAINLSAEELRRLSSEVVASSDPEVLGKLWNLYYVHAYGKPLVKPHDWAVHESFVKIKDGTQGFDRYDQYVAYLNTKKG